MFIECCQAKKKLLRGGGKKLRRKKGWGNKGQWRQGKRGKVHIWIQGGSKRSGSSRILLTWSFQKGPCSIWSRKSWRILRRNMMSLDLVISFKLQPLRQFIMLLKWKWLISLKKLTCVQCTWDVLLLVQRTLCWFVGSWMKIFFEPLMLVIYCFTSVFSLWEGVQFLDFVHVEDPKIDEKY